MGVIFWYKVQQCSVSYTFALEDIPFINRVHSPYRKLWTEVYGPSAKKKRKKRKKTGTITYGTDQANEYKRAKVLVGNIGGPYCKLWTGKLTNQSSHTMSAI